eukprot:CFRG1190T1
MPKRSTCVDFATHKNCVSSFCPPNSLNGGQQVYDYVIVGAGSAGCVMANKLSADPNVKVALLETGPDDNTALVQEPSGYFWCTPWSFKYNHRYYTKPQPGCGNRELFQPRGRGVGGSSSLNAMIYIRGLPYDYTERWAKEGKCDGWEFDKMLPIFKAHEHNDAIKDTAFHGHDGPLKIRTQDNRTKMMTSVLKAGPSVGLPLNNDFNGADQTGIGYYQMTQTHGDISRCSAATAFLSAKIRARPNLDIVTEAHVTKVVTEGKRAIGVQAVPTRSKNDHGAITFKTNKDVILCGGAFNSPQLMLLSGIGPKEVLSQHSIPVVHELPGVGKNLQDHTDIMLQSRSPILDNPFQFAVTNIGSQITHIKQWMDGKGGPFSGDVNMLGAFYKSHEDVPANDIQHHMVPFVYKNHGKSLGYGGGLTILTCYLRPKSRGSVELKSSNPTDAPLINMNFYEEEEDMAPMIAGVRKSIELIQSPELESYNFQIIPFNPDTVTDDEIAKWIRAETESVYHPTSTCKMGPSSDTMAVVDHSNGCAVHGMEGLRVIDASTFPFVVSGNTNAPTMALAERAHQLMMAAEDHSTSERTRDVIADEAQY